MIEPGALFRAERERRRAAMRAQFPLLAELCDTVRRHSASAAPLEAVHYRGPEGTFGDPDGVERRDAPDAYSVELARLFAEARSLRRSVPRGTGV